MPSRTHQLWSFLGAALLLLLNYVPALKQQGTSPGVVTRPTAIDPAARSAGANASWWQTVSTQITREEYHVSSTPEGFQAPNRAQGLRTRFREDGIAVEPREMSSTRDASWHFGWSTKRWGREGDMRNVEAATPRAETTGARVCYTRSDFDEWYENSARGLEQSFTVHARPPGEGWLCFEGQLEGGLHAEPRGEAVDLLDAHGVGVLRYADLHAFDARGRELNSCLAIREHDLRILVDDRGACYPVRIDPLMTSPAWTAESDKADANFGYSVETAGDVNGDGYSDVVVGAPTYTNDTNFEGRAYVYLGSAFGLATSPAWINEGNQNTAYFGYSVGTAGDVNGDGYSDIIVGAYLYTNDQGNEGRAYVYLGSATGLGTTPVWVVEGNQQQAFLGVSVGTAGDVNGDGYSDVIVGADAFTNGQFAEGRAYVYYGSPMGLATSPAWSAEGNQPQARFGHAVATAGDVNGDGYSDVIVGALFFDNGQTDEGRAFLYLGSASGLAASASWTAESDQTSADFATSVGTAGDVNGDGYSDVIVGADRYDSGQTEEGKAFVYAGSAGGLSVSAAWTVECDQDSAYFAASVGTAGDVNGDGYSDVIVGAPNYDNGQSNEGRAFVYLGSAGGLAASPTWTAESDQAEAGFGSVGTAGDVNGDGYSDVIVGAAFYDRGQTDEGQAYAYYGSASGLASSSAWTAESDQASAYFGYSVGTAGDVNGDGYSDVIVGAPNYDNGEANEGRAFAFYGSAAGLGLTPAWTAESDQASASFGFSVGTAGDVNGDGYSDVIIGASFYDNEQIDEGRAFVYHGSAGGLGSSPAWTAESDQGAAYFGTSVGTAGDVNGDGYSDVIVGAYAYDNGENNEGRAFVYHGSGAGLGSSPAWTAEGNQDGAWFGYSVGTAGDVNGDGYSDVIVGAPLYSNEEVQEGRAFVYHGSATGLGSSPAWTAESDQSNSNYGYSVGTAGDVNGNGYSDVIVGAYLYDNGETNEGSVFVYQGASTGLGSLPVWSAESNQADAYFGVSAGSVGDVNGDGYSDVIVGAPLYSNGEAQEGRAFVFQGSAAGLASSPAWTAESNQVAAYFANSVGTAGDVNGDGYSDAIVGAYYYSNGQAAEGRTLVYYGNSGDGIDRIPGQFQADDSAPISLLGGSDVFGLRLKTLGRTPLGRGKVRLQWEVKPFGAPFNGTGLVSGSPFDTGTPTVGTGSVVPLSGLVSNLNPNSLYHWRLRTVTDSPFFPRSPWLSLPGNAPSEADVRTPPTSIGVADVSSARTLLLKAGMPNPFSNVIHLDYTLPQRGRVRFAIYDISGREVAVLAEGMEEYGPHTQTWDGRGVDGVKLSAGVYFAQLEFAGRMEVRKIVLAR